MDLFLSFYAFFVSMFIILTAHKVANLFEDRYSKVVCYLFLTLSNAAIASLSLYLILTKLL